MHTELPILSRLVEAVAPTPLQPVQLAADQPQTWCKLEDLNPSGSTKGRIASYILSKAWRDGVKQVCALIWRSSSGSLTTCPDDNHPHSTEA